MQKNVKNFGKKIAKKMLRISEQKIAKMLKKIKIKKKMQKNVE